MRAASANAERTHYIDGRFVRSERRFAKTNPTDGTFVAEADSMVKGDGRDPVYAVERLVDIVATRGNRT